MKVVKSLKAVAAGVIAAFGLGAGSANALYLYPGAIMEDDDIEQILDAAGNVKTSGALVVGDRLRAIIEIGKIVDSLGIRADQNLGVGGEPELTGLSEIEIAAIIPLGGGQSQIIFAPSASFAADLAGLEGGVAADYAGAMVALWTDGTPDLNVNDQVTSCPTFATCEGNATNGNFWAVAGFGADPDRFWTATLSNALLSNVALLAAAGPATKLVSYNYAMEILVNNTGYDFGPIDISVICDPVACPGDQAAQIVGSGDVLGGLGLSNGAIARSDFDFTVNAIPEPGSLALVGGAFIGAGLIARRRSSKKA